MADLLIHDVTVLDCTGADPRSGMDVLVRDGRIQWIRAAGASPRVDGAEVIDGVGCTLMPGLTDAHVHFAIVGRDGTHGRLPWIEHVHVVSRLISDALDEGFTTVRDAGGLEPTWAAMVARGVIRGPRILPSGSFISQTGGHGDARQAHEAIHGGPSIPGLVAMNEVVDGVDQVRRAAREQLRRGATQIKLFASGGLASPTDPLDSLQFSVEEIAAAVDVATGWGTYVLTHSHTSRAIERSIDAGVRSIEHGTFLQPATAERMHATQTYMVPTLQVIDELASAADQSALTPEKQALVDDVYDAMRASVRLAGEVGVAVGSGSDVIGPDQGNRGREIVLKAGLIGAHAAIISATRTNAALFDMGDRIGTVEEGKEADLILVAGQPVDDVTLLGRPDRIPLVIKGGVVMKDVDGRCGPSRPGSSEGPTEGEPGQA
jgi:imidazolonepropionase-like amidohydrolase